jgi:hypothetical protein
MKRNETSISRINLSMNIPESNELIKDVHKSTDIISSLIHEYLLKRDYQKTLDSFQEELITKIKQKNYYKIAFSNITETNLLKFFNLGRKNEFLKNWRRLIPNHIRIREPPLQKLEFYIQVYFAIYPLLYRDGEINSNKTIQETMDEFKIFLEKKDSDYSKSNEFLQYYALPYVQNVKTHPTYSKLFQPEWAVELKDKIHLAIKTYLPNIKYPVLYDLVNESNANAANANGGNSNLNVSNISHKANMMKTFLENVSQEKIERNEDFNNNNLGMQNGGQNINIEEINKLREENEIYKSKLENTKANIVNIQKSWINLALNILSNSFDLVVLCKGNRNSNEVLLKSGKIFKKLLKFQSFLKKQSNNLEKYNKPIGVNNTVLSAIKEQNDEMFENIGSGFDDISGINNSMMGNNSVGINKSLDYDATHLLDINSFQISIRDEFIKSREENINNNNNLINSDNDLKFAFIIREMRLRAFRRNDAQIKQLTLFSIFYYDLIYKFNLLKEVLNRKQEYPNVSLELMKLMNKISCLKKGRNYLLMKSNSLSMIEDLFNNLKSEKQDTELRQNILATLEKFTPRLEPINKLIELGIIKWLIDTFTYEMNTLSDSTIEYGLALLLNLSLNKNGRNKFEEDAERTIQILIHYLNKDNNVHIQTSINGALYSLLRKKELKEAAKKFGIENIIQNSNITDPVNQRQISYILEELKNDNDNSAQDIDENYNEDPNVGDEEEAAMGLDDEYVEMDSIDEKMIKMHHKYVSDFIIRNDNQNEEEILKIQKFMQMNPNMLISDNRAKLDKTGDNEEINLNIDNREENENEEENEEKINEDNKDNKDKNKKNEQEKNGMEIYEQNIDIEKAFEKHDRIARTPPGELK